MKQAAALLRAAFPDWRSTVHDVIAEDAKVVERFTTWGTHEGEFMSIPGSGRRVEMDGIMPSGCLTDTRAASIGHTSYV
jgi:predicted ester cyclase